MGEWGDRWGERKYFFYISTFLLSLYLDPYAEKLSPPDLFHYYYAPLPFIIVAFKNCF